LMCVLAEVLVAPHRRAVALESHAPEHGVPRERGVVAAPGDELLDRVPTCGRPVLVMPGTDHQPATVGETFDVFEVARDRVIERQPGPLGPCREAAVVREPAGGTHVAGESVLVAEGLVHVAVDVGRFPRPARRRLAIFTVDLWAHQHAATPRPPERDLLAARVQAASAPVV